jgi:hypothetical protein
VSSKPWLASAITRRDASEKHSGPSSAAWTRKSFGTRRFLIAAEPIEDEAVDRYLGGFPLRRAFAASMCRHYRLTWGPRRWLASLISVLWENIWS